MINLKQFKAYLQTRKIVKADKLKTWNDDHNVWMASDTKYFVCHICKGLKFKKNALCAKCSGTGYVCEVIVDRERDKQRRETEKLLKKQSLFYKKMHTFIDECSDDEKIILDNLLSQFKNNLTYPKIMLNL